MACEIASLAIMCARLIRWSYNSPLDMTRDKHAPSAIRAEIAASKSGDGKGGE